jgi:hypothetical protein
MELDVKTHVGIGDILHFKQILDSVKHRYDKINITFCTDTIKGFKDDYDGYYLFMSKLFDSIFLEDPYVRNDSITVNGTSPVMFSFYNGIKPEIPYLEKYFTQGKEKEDYVVVLTKIRGMVHEVYSSFKYEYLNLLNSISKKYKILLLGEKVTGLNKEYQLLGGSRFVYSIYEDLISNIENYIDLTVDELGITSPNYENFIKDCDIMNRAKHVISLSTGGNTSLAMSVSSIINYYGNSELESFFNLMEKKEDKFITNDLNLFFSKLESICQ